MAGVFGGIRNMASLLQYLVRGIISLGLLFSLAYADSAVQQLSDQLAQFQNYQAKFTQTSFEGAQIASQNHGSVALEKPGRFRWESFLPTHQILVVNNNILWIYDVELAQVTKQKLNSIQGQGLTPAALLSGSIHMLLKNFNVQTSSSPNSSAEECFLLIPKNKDNVSFQQVQFCFKKNILVSMELLNNLGQLNQYQFSAIRVNQSLSKGIFQLQLPKDVSVIS